MLKKFKPPVFLWEPLGPRGRLNYVFKPFCLLQGSSSFLWGKWLNMWHSLGSLVSAMSSGEAHLGKVMMLKSNEWLHFKEQTTHNYSSLRKVLLQDLLAGWLAMRYLWQWNAKWVYDLDSASLIYLMSILCSPDQLLENGFNRCAILKTNRKMVLGFSWQKWGYSSASF